MAVAGPLGWVFGSRGLGCGWFFIGLGRVRAWPSHPPPRGNEFPRYVSSAPPGRGPFPPSREDAGAPSSCSVVVFPPGNGRGCCPGGASSQGFQSLEVMPETRRVPLARSCRGTPRGCPGGLSRRGQPQGQPLRCELGLQRCWDLLGEAAGSQGFQSLAAVSWNFSKVDSKLSHTSRIGRVRKSSTAARRCSSAGRLANSNPSIA